MCILLVEDDKFIGDGIKVGLSKMGFSIDWFIVGLEGKNVLYSVFYDVVIFDFILFGIDGFDILCEWCDKGCYELVLIFIVCDVFSQWVEGLCLGVDDYLCKFFVLIEVVVCFEVLICCVYGQSSSELCYGKVIFDLNCLIVSFDGESLVLKLKEFVLLELFMCNVGCVLLCKFIEEKFYIWDDEVFSNVVEVYVYYLCCKFGSDFICIVYGIGYILGDV